MKFPRSNPLCSCNSPINSAHRFGHPVSHLLSLRPRDIMANNLQKLHIGRGATIGIHRKNRLLRCEGALSLRAGLNAVGGL